MNIQMLLTLIVIGILAGTLSGLAGVGGGVIIVPLLIFLAGFSQIEAQGTSLAVLSLPVVLLAAMTYYKQGVVNWKYAVLIGLGFIIGGYLGSKTALKIDQRILRKIFGFFLLFISIRILLKK